MGYFFINNEIHGITDRKSGIFSKEEIASLALTDISVCVLNTKVKVCVAPGKNEEKNAALFEESLFEEFILREQCPGKNTRTETIEGKDVLIEDFAVQEEILDTNIFQVVGIPKQQIRDVYAIFGKEDNIKVLVPYAVALREFLKRKDFLSCGKCIVFLENIAGHVLLTIFDRQRFIQTRALLTGSFSKILSEITRSERFFAKEYFRRESKNPAFQVVSNNKGVIDEITGQGLHVHEDAVFIEEKYPSLKGLQDGRFDMHFDLPENLLKKRRKEDRRKVIIYSGISAALTGGGILFLLFSTIRASIAENRFHKMTAEKMRLENMIENETIKRYEDSLRQEAKVDIPALYADFVRNIPEGYIIKNFTLENKNRAGWIFEAVIVLNDKEKGIRQFSKKNLFSESTVSDILLDSRPGQKIFLKIKE